MPLHASMTYSTCKLYLPEVLLLQVNAEKLLDFVCILYIFHRQSRVFAPAFQIPPGNSGFWESVHLLLFVRRRLLYLSRKGWSMSLNKYPNAPVNMLRTSRWRQWLLSAKIRSDIYFCNIKQESAPKKQKEKFFQNPIRITFLAF